jgi:nicotinamidase-related amidase
VALVLIDVINTMSFEGSEALVRRALPMARRLAALRKKAKQNKVPTIYVNDNFGRWRSDFRATVKYCLRPESPGRKVAALLKPSADDYFVLKPKHSGFHATALDVLLEYLGTRVLVFGGVAANICVLFTANDAYMRDFRICVPRDCVASNTDRDTRYALAQMKRFLKADLRESTKVDFDALKR